MLEIKELDRKQWKNYELVFSYDTDGYYSFEIQNWDLKLVFHPYPETIHKTFTDHLFGEWLENPVVFGAFYRIVFAPKYRRQAIYKELRADIGVILRKLCEQKGVEIIEVNACCDHIHMLLSIPPKYSVSQIVGFLKGKSSLMIFDRHANLKYKYGNRHFWARGYYVDTVGRNKKQKSAARRSFGRP